MNGHATRRSVVLHASLWLGLLRGSLILPSYIHIVIGVFNFSAILHHNDTAVAVVISAIMLLPVERCGGVLGGAGRRRGTPMLLT